MAFFDKKDEFQKWKYKIAQFILLYPDGSKFELPPERIQSISITHSYETAWYPVFRTEVILEPSVYYSIIKYKDDIQIKLRILKYYTKIGSGPEVTTFIDTSSNTSLTRNYIDGKFDLILDDQNFDVDEYIKVDEKRFDFEHVTKDDKNDLFKTDNKIELFLFKSSLIDKGNQIVNAVLHNASVTDAVAYILYTAKYKNVLLSPIQNKDIYSELIIPPLKAKEALQYIGTYYGYYKNGYIIYVDFTTGKTYILNRSGKCTAWEANEYTETDIVIPNDKESCTLGRKKSKNINYIIGHPSTMAIRNESTSLNAYSSLDSLSIDTYTGDVISSKSNASSKGTTSVKVLSDTTENKWFKTLHSSLNDSKNTVMQITASDYDVGAIAPNKRYKVLFENSKLAEKYKDDYIMSECIHTFTKTGADFSITSVFTMQKCD
jgi:hypothetical protein